jgi:hypothetical protein
VQLTAFLELTLKVSELFDHVYVVHLPNEQRMLHITDQLKSVGIREATFVHADPPPNGFTVPNMRRNPRAEFGVGLSHIAAVVRAIADGAEWPLFVEDDVTFTSAEIGPIRKWDVLYLGGHPRGPAQLVATGIAKVGKFSCAEAYSVRGWLLPELHRYWCNRVTRPDAMFDFILGEFAAAHDSYACYPVVTEQAQFVSHIKGEIDDKRKLVDRGWQNNLSTK